MGADPAPESTPEARDEVPEEQTILSFERTVLPLLLFNSSPIT